MYLIPRLSPPFQCDDLHSLLRGWLRGDGTERLEEAMTRFLGAPYALAYPFARSALFALARVMGWRGREMVLPAFTCAVMAHAIVASGNRPRFVDIALRDFNLEPAGVASVLGPRTALVVATHMYGFPMDLAGLQEVLSPHPQVSVVQDCALALGTTYRGSPVWKFGQAALYSFTMGKPVSAVEGGVLVTGDHDLYRALRQDRKRWFSPPGLAHTMRQSLLFAAAWQGLRPRIYPLVYFLAYRSNLLGFLTRVYRDDRISLPRHFQKRLPSCLGHLGANQVSKAAGLIARKNRLARQWLDILRDVPGVTVPSPRQGASFSHCPCLVDAREEFRRFLLKRGIHVGVEVFDYVVPHLPVFCDSAGEREYAVASRVARELVLLPNHALLRPRDEQRVSRALEAWRRTRRKWL